ncbi:MAG: hypothetical protein ACWA5W_09970 [Phycisphaerales bacterium]
MPITVTEKFESRRSTTGDNPSAELGYTVRGTDDDLAARSAVEAASPTTYDNLPRQAVAVEPVGPEHWDATVRFAPNHQSSPPQTGESVFNFDTGGGSQHITQSKATIGTYAAPGTTAPNFQGGISVTADSVNGVDITVPVYQFSETHYLPAATVSEAYKVLLFELTGKVNSAGFKGFAAGEVLFLGASGSRRGTDPQDDWEISFRFAVSPNVTGLAVGPITGINKQGWEYLWVRYADAEDTAASTIVKRPIAAYVERVYDTANLGAMGI